MLSADYIKKAARDLSFDGCGVVALEQLPGEQQQRFSEWMAKGYHARMSYLKRFPDKRADPRLMLRDGAKTAVIVLFSYNTGQQQPRQLPQVSRYAYGMDYHELLKKKLWALLKALQKDNPKLRGRTFADTAPLQERYWAAVAGLGWIGKNGMLVNRTLGSYVYIGTLLLNAAVESAPQQVRSYCGTCTRCLEACPTQAIVGNAVVDARRCWSYRTIEAHVCEKNAEAVAEKTIAPDYIFGCDICQSVCPWNEKAALVFHSEMQMLPPLQTLTRDAWLAMPDADFEKMFEHSAIRRATLEGMKRNVGRR